MGVNGNEQRRLATIKFADMVRNRALSQHKEVLALELLQEHHPLVRDLNFKCLSEGKGAPVTARFGPDSIMIVDLICANIGKVFQRIYDKVI